MRVHPKKWVAICLMVLLVITNMSSVLAGVAPAHFAADIDSMQSHNVMHSHDMVMPSTQDNCCQMAQPYDCCQDKACDNSCTNGHCATSVMALLGDNLFVFVPDKSHNISQLNLKNYHFFSPSLFRPPRV